ncbi:MFS multidrug transporter-like protein [Xylaria sp. FL0043]|nr:MFS multidrug transporter-like protein [Xylaria sp. FL0043]
MGSPSNQVPLATLDNDKPTSIPSSMRNDNVPVWTRPSITVGSGEQSPPENQLSMKQDALTDWDGPADPANPKNWSLGLRIYHTMLPALYGFSVSLGTSIYSAGVFAVMDEFHVSMSVSLLGLSLYALGLALGPVVGAPISETRGRKAVYLITLPLFLLFTAGAGLSMNIQTFIILRILSSTFGSPALAVGAGTVADIWDMEHGGGLATVLITSTFFLGPSLGPLIGGYTLETRGDWRWLMWVMLLIAGPIGILALPSRETSKKIILAQRAKQRGVPGPPRPPPLTALKMLFVITLVRPLKMLVSEPIVMSWALYHSFVFGVLFAFFESYPYVFGRVYGFSSGQIGLAFLGIFIGNLLAVVTFGIIDKVVYQKKKVLCAPAKPPPEERLYTSMLGAFGIPVALFWFAWTARADIHFLVPIAAGIPFGWGVVTLFLGGITFLLDTYGAMYSASAVAANGLLRYAFGAGFPLFTIQMYEKLGIGWATSLLGFIGLALLPIPFMLYKFGPALRRRSRMTAE